MKVSKNFLTITLLIFNPIIGYSQQNDSLSSIQHNFISALVSLSEAFYYEGNVDDAVQILESNLGFAKRFTPDDKAKVFAQYSRMLYYKHSVQGKSYNLPVEKIKEAISLAEATSNLQLIADLQGLMGLALYSRHFLPGNLILQYPITKEHWK